MSIEIRKLVAGDEAVLEKVAPNVFDEPVRPDLTKRFLATPNYCIFVALDGDLVVGMATGFTHFHPDKPEEFFVNEVGSTTPICGKASAPGCCRRSSARRGPWGARTPGWAPSETTSRRWRSIAS